MSDLEDLIREVAKRGELTHLSLTPRDVKDANEKVLYRGWGATFSPASSQANTFAEDRDPVVALKTAIEEAKMRRGGAPFQDGDGAKAKPKAKVSKPLPADSEFDFL